MTIYAVEAQPPALVAVPLGGGQASPFVPGSATAVAVDEQRVYWSDGSSILGCDKSTCAATTVVVAPGNALDMAVDGNSVYWITADRGAAIGEVMKADKAGGQAVQLATAASPYRLALDAQNVYWADRYAGLMAVPIAGGSVVALAVEPDWTIAGLALDPQNVYFATADGRLFVVPKQGGAVRALLTDLASAVLVNDGTNLYVPSHGLLVRMPVAGGPVTPVASGLGAVAAMALAGHQVVLAEGGAIVAVTAFP